MQCLKNGPQAVTYTPQTARHQEIVSIHMQKPFTPTRETATKYGLSLDTVRRHLKAAGLKCCRPARKIDMTPAHQKERVRFARQYLNFDWCNNIVIFTDEKTFKSDKDGRKILWRTRGTRYHKDILPCRSSGRITLGYWGWMSSMGPGELVKVGPHFNSHRYLEILRDFMIPSVRMAYPSGQIYFVHDNSAVHKARIVRDWLQNQSDVTVIEWPSKSPDLNPIENGAQLGSIGSQIQGKSGRSSN